MNSQNIAVYYGLAAVLCWSTVATAFKLSLVYLTPIQLILVASFTSWLFLVGYLVFTRRVGELFSQSGQSYLVSLGFGVLNPTVYYLLLFYAYDQLPAQEAQAINYSWAIVMSLLAVPLLGHKLRWFDIVAAIVCYCGVLVIATRGAVFDLEFSNIGGVGLALASTLVWSLYWIFNKKLERDPVVGLCLNFSFALPLIFLIAGVQGELNNARFIQSWPGMLGGAYVGLFEMGLAFLLWLKAMQYAENTARIANLIFISPFLSLLFIAVFLSEPILSSTLVGLTLIVSGLVFQQSISSGSN